MYTRVLRKFGGEGGKTQRTAYRSSYITPLMVSHALLRVCMGVHHTQVLSRFAKLTYHSKKDKYPDS